MLTPVKLDDALVGILVMGDPLGEVSRYTIEERNLLVAVADHVALALEAAHLAQVVLALDHEASHDPLTGLVNRARFEQGIAERLATCDTCAVLFLDLDGFKGVNDTWGHGAGDAVLRMTADRLSGAGGAGTEVGRLGGDEFGVLAASPADARALADQILAALGRPIVLPNGVAVTIEASIGVAYASRGDEPSVVLAAADDAMYTAKRRGRARIEVSGQPCP